MDATPRIRIGELSRRVGVSRELLRTWERRYGLLQPVRGPENFRLYSDDDERRVRVMQEQLTAGVSAGDAARVAVAATDGAAGPRQLAGELGAALEAFDEQRAHAALDRLFAVFGVEHALRDGVLPYLHDLGNRWSCAEVTVAQEHFASRLLEARLLALARGWNKGPGPCAVLACPPGEQHTLALISFGLALRNRGWRNIYLGADTPPATARMAADRVRANLLVLAAVTPARFLAVADELGDVERGPRIVLGGAGATPDVAARIGVAGHQGDPITTAEALSIAWSA